jgi:hypothetical protein
VIPAFFFETSYRFYNFFMLRCSYISLFLCIWEVTGYSQSIQTQESVLAKAGYIFITEREFLERFELLPNQFRNRPSNIEESKLLFLYSLIAEKLLAQEAEMRHLDQDSVFQQALHHIKKNLVRDQLYREQIREKVKVSRPEVQKAIVDAERQLFLSFLYFEDRTDAAFVRKQLKNCKQFNAFQIDASMKAIRDTATLTWGEAEAPIEQAAFRLKKGECSPVVTASTGYYILHVDKEWQNTFYSSMEPNVLYERVETKLRLRKEKARLDEYLETAFLSKAGFSLPQPFVALAKTLIEAWKNKTAGSEEIVNDSLLEILHDRCQTQLQDSLVVVGQSYWTVEDVLYRLRGKIFTIDPSRTTGIAAQLNNHLLILVQQELLAEEGLSQKLEERASVKNELDIWRQQILAKSAEIDFQRRVPISDQDIFQYLAETEPELQYPKIQIRELHTLEMSMMETALKEVRSGIPLEEVIKKRSSDVRSVHQGGLSDEFAMNTRVPLGLLAWRMKIGEQQGPIHINNDYIYFELVKKEYPAGVTDSSFSSIIQRIASYARSLKQKRMLDVFIAKSAQERGYTVYADRLKMLKVSTVPMMTYRILGFGGRMFAAPFVTPQVDWLGVENPEKIPLP